MHATMFTTAATGCIYECHSYPHPANTYTGITLDVCQSMKTCTEWQQQWRVRTQLAHRSTVLIMVKLLGIVVSWLELG